MPETPRRSPPSACARCQQLEGEVQRLQAVITALRRQLSEHQAPLPAASPALDSGDKADTAELSVIKRDTSDTAIEGAAELLGGDAERQEDSPPSPSSNNFEALLSGLTLSTPPATTRPRSPPPNHHAPNNTRGSRARPSTSRDRRRLDFDGAA